ncbi:MAG: GIY-YIG nuclease family protein [Flavobacteriales bacterium]|nr:GIY-YIG nuclease family protein [Flavobacteriales bacterium]
MKKAGGYAYLVTSRKNTALYAGSTTDILRRTGEHKDRFYPRSFTARYNADKLVWYHAYPTLREARQREAQIKAGSRAKKEALVNAMNPSWEDLFPRLLKEAEEG